MKTLLIAMLMIDGWDTTYQPQECSVTWDTEIIPQQLETAPADASPRLRLQFWGAPWCGNCPAAKAQSQQAASELGVELEYFNYDQNKDTAKQLGIGSVPQLHYVVDDKIIERRIGYESSAGIVGKANEAVASAADSAGDKQAQHVVPSVREKLESRESAFFRNSNVSMQWSFEGNRFPSREHMISHLLEHGVDGSQMTMQEMASTHDAIHNGRRIPLRQSVTSQAACPTCPQPQLQRRGGRFFGIFGR